MVRRILRFGHSSVAVAIVACVAIGPTRVDAQVRLIGDPVDVSEDFARPENVYFVAGALRVYGAGAAQARGFFALPDGDVQAILAVRRGGGYALKDDVLHGKVKWTLTRR